MTPIPAHTGAHTSAQHIDLPTPLKTRITAATVREIYAGNELSAPATRPGADDALALPSRIDRQLHYRDGRTGPFATPATTTTTKKGTKPHGKRK